MIWLFVPFGKMASWKISKDIWTNNTNILIVQPGLPCLSGFLFLKLMPDVKEDNLILMIWIESNNYSPFCWNRLQGIFDVQNLSLSLAGSLLAVSVDSKCDNRATGGWLFASVELLLFELRAVGYFSWRLCVGDGHNIITLQPSSTSFLGNWCLWQES